MLTSAVFFEYSIASPCRPCEPSDAYLSFPGSFLAYCMSSLMEFDLERRIAAIGRH